MNGERITPLAAAFAAGITTGAWPEGAITWPWVALAAAALAGAACCPRRPAAAMVLLSIAALGLGATWFQLRCRFVAPGDLAALAGAQRMPLRLRGTALEAPTLRDRTAGSMALFDHRPPATYFALRVETLVARGRSIRARGEVLVRVEETVAPFRAGARVAVAGMLLPPRPARNPGEFDFLRHARSIGRAGLVNVPRRELVAVEPARETPLRAALHLRERLRGRAGAWLLSNLPDSDRRRRDALLAALLLGQRAPELDGLGETFRGAGLAHFLAVSGLHLGVLAGCVLFCARLGGAHRRWHGALLVAVVLGYLVVVEARMPVLRAGLMTIAASAGLLAGRRLRVGGLVSASAVALLLWRPGELFSPGFQLSYGVVLGLVHLAPRLRDRFFGRPNLLAASPAEMLGQWLRTACAAAVTAWAVATPIAICHWGECWPLAAPFSVVVLPVVAAVLALGYVKMILAVILPSAALLAGVPLSFATNVLIAAVEALDAAPGSSLAVGHAPPAWALAAEAWVAAWALLGGRVFGFWGSRRGRWLLRGAGLVVAAWLAGPLLVPGTAALRLDMLAVGDGSCYVLRSGRSAVVFDAGSASSLDAGRRLVVPALLRLGVRRLDAVVISHANLDHYSAVVELAESFRVGEVLITPQFAAAAERDPAGPAMHLLEALAALRVPVRSAAAGTARVWGRATWTWLHPRPGAAYDGINDESAVVRVEAAGRTVLLCGDIESAAIAAIEPFPVDVMELPHHGAWHDEAEAFVAAMDPRVVLQSTGPARRRRTAPRWAAALGGAEHLLSDRDGACAVEIDAAGRISTRRFLPAPAPLP